MTLVFLSGLAFLHTVYSSCGEERKAKGVSEHLQKTLGILRHTWSGVLEMLISLSHEAKGAEECYAD